MRHHDSLIFPGIPAPLPRLAGEAGRGHFAVGHPLVKRAKNGNACYFDPHPNPPPRGARERE